jgi:hypothetical protein
VRFGFDLDDVLLLLDSSGCEEEEEEDVDVRKSP